MQSRICAFGPALRMTDLLLPEVDCGLAVTLAAESASITAREWGHSKHAGLSLVVVLVVVLVVASNTWHNSRLSGSRAEGSWITRA